MSIEKEYIPQLLKDLEISRDIEDAYQILDLSRDGKWSVRLLLLSYLLKENELQKISEFVDFGFSKTAEDSLFHRFNFPKIRSALALPEKWFEDTAEYISGSGNARSLLSKRTDLFTKIDSRYTLNNENGARNLALVLYIFLIKAHKIDLTETPEVQEGSKESGISELYQKLLLIDSTGAPTRFFQEIQTLIENQSILAQDTEFDRDERSILPYIQTVILNLLLKHDNAFSKSPRKKKLKIVADTFYTLSVSKGHKEFNVDEWLNHQPIKTDRDHTELDEERPEESISTIALLVGSAGSGKSFWMIQQACELWNETFDSSPTQSNSHKLIPIFLELGAMFLDRTKRGEALVYAEGRSPLLYKDEELGEMSRSTLIARSLEAMLNKFHGHVPKILDRIDWKMEYVIFLDGWDELKPVERNEAAKFVDACRKNEIPCIISSRTSDLYLEKIEPVYLNLEAPSNDSCTVYLRSRGMDAAVLGNISKWFPNLTPLDLEILGRVPKMEEVSYGRVPVYRSWIELQVLSSIHPNIPHDIRSRSEIDRIIEGNVYAEKTLKDWIRSRDVSHSVWRYLPYIAYLQREGRNTTLSYDQVLQYNPLLKNLLEKRYGSGDSPYPEIARNNLIPYLSAEYIFRSYLSGKYPPIRGDSQTFSFLVEILSYDLERRHEGEPIHRSAELSPLEISAMICIQGESESFDSGMKIQPIKPTERSRATPFYNALFTGLVRYWTLSQDQRSRRRILRIFTNLLRDIIIEEKDDIPEQYIVPLIEIENALGTTDISKLIPEDPEQQKGIAVRDSLGYILYHLDYDKIQDWLLHLTSTKPWLTPWTIRVLEPERLPKIIKIIDEAHDKQMIYDVFRYVTSNFTSIGIDWLESLYRNAARLNSEALWTSLAYIFLNSNAEMDDARFSIFLETIGSSYVEEKLKLKLIYNISKITLPERYTREVWMATERNKIDSKYGIAICLSQELPEISLDDIFDVIRKSDGWKWLGLLLPELLKEEYDEAEINRHFVQLSYTIMQAIRKIKVAPWDKARLRNLIDLWWDSNLQTIDDAMRLLYIISKPVSEIGQRRLDYRATEVIERIASWLKTVRKSTKKKFFHKLIKSEIDMMDFQIDEYLYPLYKEIDDRSDLDDLLVERYTNLIQGLLYLPLSRDSWIKHIDKVDWDEILEWSYLMEAYLESGHVKTIEDAIKILDDILALRNCLIETFDPLVSWVMQRPKGEIAAFILRLLEKDPTSRETRYWQRIKKSGLVESLSPISTNSPQLYARILEIAEEMPLSIIDTRSVLQFLFEHLTPEDKLRIVRPHFDKYLDGNDFFYSTALEEMILLYGTKKDMNTLIRSLNKEPRYLGAIWSKNPERAREIAMKLTNPFARLLYEIDMEGGWDEYKKKLESDPKKAEETLLLFIENDRTGTVCSFLTSGRVLREVALKHWKMIFPHEGTVNSLFEIYLGDLFDEDSDEIVEYVAREVDRIHKDLKKREKKEPLDIHTPWFSWDISTLDKIRDRCGFHGLKRLLAKVKDPYAIEGVMTYLVGAAKKEGVPKSEIISMKEYKKLRKATRWYLIRDYEKVKDN
ncbi:MAG: hypothetical protein K9W43_13715 [Candidatus Thorarchaeota archaeon]|nr:hypothetical protein [Candidatus Thorarchaeota archaeon]